MRPRVRATRAILLVLITLIPGSFTPSFAQTTAAQITGTVADETGSVMPGAEVSATNLGTGAVQMSVTSSEGIYRLLNLQPGRYRIEARMPGFKTFVQESVTLRVNDRTTLPIRLEVGEISDQITVTGQALLLELQDASFGTVVDERNIRELPLNVRDAISLISLTPGVITAEGFGAAGGTPDVGRSFFKSDFNVGGGQMRGQEILIDGAPSTTSDRSFATYIPSVDSTQEFKVQANSFSAEFGRTTGGVVSVVTKSGSNEFHGTAYEFHRNSVLDANDFFANRSDLDKTSFRRHQFGANTGGRILRDKTFFFVAYEGFRQAFPGTVISTVPTDLQRQGDFSQTFASNGQLIRIFDPNTLRQDESGNFIRNPFPNNILPQDRFDPVARAAMGFFPIANLPGDTVTGANNFAFADQSTTNRDRFDFRVDQHFGQTNQLFGRLSYENNDRKTPRAWDNPAAHLARLQKDQYYHAVISDTHTFSPTLLGELRVSFTRGHPQQTSQSEGFDLGQLGFPASYVQVAHAHFPFFNISDVARMGNGVFNNQPRNTYVLQANATKIFSRHTFKAGVDYRILDFHALQDTNPTGSFNFGRLFTQGPNPLQASRTAGHGLASFLLGTGTGGSINHTQGLSLRRYYYAFYVQDDWKVTPQLTFNLGLRYDLDIGQFDFHDRLTNLDLNARSPLSDLVGIELRGLLRYLGTDGHPRNQLDTDKNNFGPRIGFAYNFAPKTVLRAGYGVFYIPMVVIADGSIGFNTSTPWIATLDNLNPENLLSNPFPQGFNLPTNSRNPLQNVGFGISGFIREEQVGYTQQWNVSFQRQFSSDLMIDLGYWGNKGTKLQYSGWRENDLPNEFLSLGTALNERVPNPFFGVITAGALSGPTITRNQSLRPYPQYTAVNRTRVSAGSQIYHAFTAKVDKRLSEGLSLMGSYTISKNISDTPGRDTSGGSGGIRNMENRRAERSLTPFDVPQRLVVAFVYDLPFGHGSRYGSTMHPVLNAILGGWTFSGISTFQGGFPIVNITRSANNDGRSAKLSNPTIAQWFDTSVFTPAAPFTFGNVPPVLPDVRRDGINNFDFTLAKNFFVGDRFRIQFRSEFYNAFNTPQFGAPVGGVTSSSFGVVNSQANPPREIQFGLKLIW
ncbi:MAG: TonB-dependent receptor domain-containing protein [Acidobacteriota bacterium]